MQLIQNLMDRLDPLIRLASKGEALRFLGLLIDSDLFFLHAPIEEGLDPETMTEEELIDLIEHGANALSEAEALEPFIASDQKVDYLPLFSKETIATRFVQRYVAEVNRVIPFSIVSVPATQLLESIIAVEEVVLNPGSPHAHTFTEEEVSIIREGLESAWNSRDSDPEPKK